MGKIGLLLKPDKIKILIFALLFAVSSIYYEVWAFMIQLNVDGAKLFHGLPLSFYTTVFGIDWGGEPLGFFPINLVLDLIFLYLLSCLISFLIRDKEAVKQFLRPNKTKIAAFALLFVLGTIYSEIWYQIWSRFVLGPSPSYYEFLIHHGFPLSFYTTRVVWGAAYPFLPLSIEYILPTVTIDLIFLYLVSCSIVFVYQKILKPLYAKKPKNNGSEMST